MATHNILPRAYERAFGKSAPTAPRAGVGGDGSDIDDRLPGAEMGPDNEAELDAHGASAVPAEPLYAPAILDGNPDEVDAHSIDAAEVNAMEDPAPGVTSYERASTYRATALRWFATAPQVRFAAMRQIHTVQQDAIILLMTQVGSTDDKKEVIRRVDGHKPRF